MRWTLPPPKKEREAEEREWRERGRRARFTSARKEGEMKTNFLFRPWEILDTPREIQSLLVPWQPKPL